MLNFFFSIFYLIERSNLLRNIEIVALQNIAAGKRRTSVVSRRYSRTCQKNQQFFFVFYNHNNYFVGLFCVYLCMCVFCVQRKQKIDYMCYTCCLFSLQAQLFYNVHIFFLPHFCLLQFSLLFPFYFSFFLFHNFFLLSSPFFTFLSLPFIYSFYLILNKAMDLTSLSAYKLNKSFVCENVPGGSQRNSGQLGRIFVSQYR